MNRPAALIADLMSVVRVSTSLRSVTGVGLLTPSGFAVRAEDKGREAAPSPSVPSSCHVLGDGLPLLKYPHTTLALEFDSPCGLQELFRKIV